MIAQKIKEYKEELPPNVKLLAVSKYHPVEALQEAYDAGQRAFGESRAQELTQKYEVLPKDIEWHFIGHLQTNKVKYIAPFVSLIHSVDSEEVLAEIDKQAKKNNREIECLLEIHVAQEETKFGYGFKTVREFLSSGRLKNYSNVSLVGIMGMASNVDDDEQIRREFHELSSFFQDMKKTVAPQFRELSMGMSGDYKIAIEEGSTIVRLGTSIFGERQY